MCVMHNYRVRYNEILKYCYIRLFLYHYRYKLIWSDCRSGYKCEPSCLRTITVEKLRDKISTFFSIEKVSYRYRCFGYTICRRIICVITYDNASSNDTFSGTRFLILFSIHRDITTTSETDIKKHCHSTIIFFTLKYLRHRTNIL